ncbi:MAG TPA: hypothetical protein VE244_12125 [Nitrososphaeraceae archaeon]|jgi:hypothetical protein|nr:hypothetical protein [Nitrososphaeraceae archaeon]
MHKEQQQRQQHLKSNNIISKLAVITLSIVLLTGISLFPALQIGVYGQVQQQQQQQQTPPVLPSTTTIDRLYIPLVNNGNLTALDAATGQNTTLPMSIEIKNNTNGTLLVFNNESLGIEEYATVCTAAVSDNDGGESSMLPLPNPPMAFIYKNTVFCPVPSMENIITGMMSPQIESPVVSEQDEELEEEEEEVEEAKGHDVTEIIGDEALAEEEEEEGVAVDEEEVSDDDADDESEEDGGDGGDGGNGDGDGGNGGSDGE